eukprot:TRINITY_DN11154_c0_g1_i3.p1 TRINITY_DN11154_c0_g1~~TRINITY_DN11154_c0_g1_i3.p1  ORF type:complete len:419 (+),score=91.40 TRINITY_DN11154_c0_g1_i3:116-1372(+)
MAFAGYSRNHAADAPIGTSSVFSKSAKFQMTPRIVTRSTFDAVEQRFKLMVSGGSKGRTELWKAWHDIDYNGNQRVSLAEIDKWIVESYDALLNNKPALMRAYRSTVAHEQDEFVHKMDFPVLLRNIVYFNKLWQAFDEIDADNDRRLTFGEFRAGLSKVGLSGRCDPHTVFTQLDTNRGGVVLFDEFCKWVAATECPVDSSVYDPSAIAAGQAASQAGVARGALPQGPGSLGAARAAAAAPHGGAAGRGHIAAGPRGGAGALAHVENAFKILLKDKRRLHEFWSRIDYNGNGIVSLAEIDKLVCEAYPELDNKPALMRAYKAACRRADGYVHKPELKRLLRNLVYFNKVWAVFGMVDADGDRRLTFAEFKGASAQMGVSLQASEARDEFDFMDANNGGMVLFDEFCTWVAEKKMPID